MEREREAGQGGGLGMERLLLLLATENADKGAGKPAGFEERLGMMVLMARELAWEVRDAREKMRVEREGGNEVEGGMLMVDIGVTKKPYFIDKAKAIDESGVYGRGVEQVHLTGFDTLTRIFDRKYYGEEGLGVLGPFLERHMVRAVVRPDEVGKEGKGEKGWGTKGEQEEWLDRMKRGEMEGEELKREWAEKIELVDGGSEADGVSSTKAREAVKEGRWKDLEGLLGKSVAGWVRERGLYKESG